MTSVRRLPAGARWAFWIAVVLGLAARVAAIPLLGGPDVDTYARWGERVAHLGLVHGYRSDYYPLANQLFGAAAELGSAVGSSTQSVLKAFNLVAECSSLALLVTLLGRWGRSPLYALIYWLHPYFVLTAFIGYVDSWLGCMFLAALLVLSGGSGRGRLLVAGAFLGAAFAMKPQAVFPVAMLGAVVAVVLLVYRRWTPIARDYLHLLVGSAVLFVVYTAVFWASGAGIDAVARIYAGPLGARSTPLSANMLNLWHVVASVERAPGQQIYQVTRPQWLHPIAFALTAALLAGLALRQARSRFAGAGRSFLELAALSAVIVPLWLMGVHENHFFLGAVLGIALIAWVADRRLTLVMCALLLVQAWNLIGLYGLGRNSASGGWVAWVMRQYSFDARMAAAIVGTLLGAWLLVGLARVTSASATTLESAPR